MPPTLTRQKPRRHSTGLDINHLKLDLAAETSGKIPESNDTDTLTENCDKEINSPSLDLACYEMRCDNLEVDSVEEASTGSSDPSEGPVFIVTREQTKPVKVPGCKRSKKIQK